jgi:alpha-galactosidase
MNGSLSLAVSVILLASDAIGQGADVPRQGSEGRTNSLRTFAVTTAHSALRLYVGADGRVYELGYGGTEAKEQAGKQPDRETEFYPQFGDGYILEPALMATHADGNTSTSLIYVRHQTSALDGNVMLTRLELKDPAYPFFVTLCFKAYGQEDVIEQWAEIHHEEPGAVVLQHFASTSPLFRGKEYWLSQFCGDYAKEANLLEEKLGRGLKILDSKIGVRSSQFCIPSFVLALNGPAQEESGEVYAGSLKWSGSFQLAFEMDAKDRLRSLCGINPFGQQYRLAGGEAFSTPGMLWTWSGHGKGQASRNLHAWAIRYGIRDGAKARQIVLNNWEATGFKFDEQTIVSLFDGARELGVDTFLLDDGWFGNAHPRNHDRAGLGDWQVNTNKLPRGLGYLAQQARQRGVQFGIWIEPEMVNPSSELFERHPEWAIQQPHRSWDLDRNQLDLDLSRPAVRDFVWNVIDQTVGVPGVDYVKWDANRYVTQPGSTYLPAERQSELLIRYNFALYELMERMAQKYPNVMAMLCSGGGGRVDYGALRYFDLFWPSDNTDPLRRVYIQWGYSHFFPAETLAAHVTRMGNRPMKFCVDVAMSGALGVDLDVRKLKPQQRQELAAAIALYKRDLCAVVEHGSLHRLESPYASPRSALNYVSADQSRSVLFVYQVKEGLGGRVKLRGLNPKGRYQVKEVNLPAGVKSAVACDGQAVLGAELMEPGLEVPCRKTCESAVVLLEAQSKP